MAQDDFSMRTPADLIALLDDAAPGPDPWEAIQVEGRAIVLRRHGVIAKCFVARSTFDAEAWGLRAVAEHCPESGPGLVSVFEEQAVVLMEDLGAGSSLADALLGDSASDAQEVLNEYVDGLAALHNRTMGRHAATAPPWWLTEPLGQARAALSDTGALPAGLHSPSHEANAELDDAIRTVFEPGPQAVLSFGDMCPDNNLRTDTGFKFFDLEGAGFVDPALDIANLVVPFPTCWCCFDLPSAVRDEAVTRYVDQRQGDPLTALASVVAIFTMLPLGITAVRVAAADETHEVDGVALPTMRQVVLHRLARGVETLRSRNEYPALADWFVASLNCLTAAWPDLDTFPTVNAFADRHDVPEGV